MTQEEINKIINASTLPLKENLLYILAEKMRTLRNDIEADIQTLRMMYRTNQIDVDRKVFREFEDYVMLTQRAKLIFDKVFDVQMDNGLNWKDKDRLREDANELLRLDLLFIDRAALDLDHANSIFKYIRSLPSSGIISEKEIARFNFKA